MIEFHPSPQQSSMRIAVLGLGHVGLPTALGLAELGWHVTGADEAEDKVELMKSGTAPFYEPGLADLLGKHLASGRFTVTTDVAAAVALARVIFICVGTPERPEGEDGAPDLSQVEAATRVIAQNLNGYKLIVEKSTVPAGTARWMKELLERDQRARAITRDGDGFPDPDAGFDVASNPEFLQEGRAIERFFHPDRIIVGTDSPRARAILAEIYRPFSCPVLFTTPSTAEMIKQAANTFLAAKISFINMVADLCDSTGADVDDVARGIGLDPRIGGEFLEAGIGFGGSCFPKDLRAFIHLAKAREVDCSLAESAERINQRRVEVFLGKVRKAVGDVRGKTLAALGLAFKAHTDDLREAPGLKIIEALVREGARLRVYDPVAVPNARRSLPERPGQIIFCSSAYEAAKGSAALMALTGWDEFRRLDLSRLKDSMEAPVIVDGRNVFDPQEAASAGFEYHGMGRASARAARQKMTAIP